MTNKLNLNFYWILILLNLKCFMWAVTTILNRAALYNIKILVRKKARFICLSSTAITKFLWMVPLTVSDPNIRQSFVSLQYMLATIF